MAEISEFPYERIVLLVRDEVARGLESMRLELKSSGEMTNLGIAGINQRLDRLNGKTDRTANTVAEHETRIAVITDHCNECSRDLIARPAVEAEPRRGVVAGMALGFGSVAVLLFEAAKLIKDYLAK